MSSEPPVVVRIDIAPSFTVITRPGEQGVTYDSSRTIVTADRVYVFRDDGRGAGPALFFEGRIESFDGRNTTGYTLVTADGTYVYFKRSTGCACGSRIKSFRPFPQGMVQGPYPVQ